MKTGHAATALLRAIAFDQRPPEWPSTAQLTLLVQAGLGPLFSRLIADAATPPREAAELLRAADLTARLFTDQLIAAITEILQSAGKIAERVVLLKGIATCARHYPEPHHRLMGDIDLLVPRNLQADVESLLQALGYTQRSDLPPEFYVTHHHSMPFFHAKAGVWVEIHTELLPTSIAVAQDACFAIDNVWANTLPIAFGESQTRVLNDELHLLYTCTHWAVSLNIDRGITPILDVIFLLRANRPLDWDRIAVWTQNSSASMHLALMLEYLASRDIIALEPSAARVVAHGLRRVGPLNAKLLYRIIDKYIVERDSFGRFATHYNTLITWDTLLRPFHPWRNLAELPLSLLFPPGRVDRFSATLALRRLWAVISR